MQLPEKAIAEFQKIHKDKYGEDLPYDQASEQAHNFMRFVKCLQDMYIDDCRRKERLKKEPKGFVLPDVGYTCSICGQHTRKDENWYDKYGIKCTTCQTGINKKQIPPSLAKFEHQWYKMIELEMRFNLKPPTVRKWFKEGILKARSIIRENGSTHVLLFLIRDNKDFLPPKHLTESRSVSEEKDGRTWIHSEPWYRFVDPFEHLKGYKIMDYLQWSEPETEEEVK